MDGLGASLFCLFLVTVSRLLLSDLAQGGLIDDCSGVFGGNSSGFVFVGWVGNGLTRG